jgi:superfamily II DNA or RNA helicase
MLVTAKPVIVLRDYQARAVEAILESMAAGHNPICRMATGGGKSLVAASVCTRLDGRILLVTHRKELLEQNEAKLSGMGYSDIGVYSAGLSRREMDARVILGGVQSIYKRMDKLQAAGPFRYLIVDECHMMEYRSESSMYKRLIESCRELESIIGLTATPYRLTRGVNKPIFGLSDSWFDHLAVDIGMIELVKQGWLASLRGTRTASQVDISGVKITGDDYNTGQLSEVLSSDEIVDMAVSELCRLASDRKSWLVFCVDIAHAEAVVESERREGIDAHLVTGATPPRQRREILGALSNGDIRCVTSVGVLTTGVDIPRIDMIGLIRPTKSKALLVQMIGRGSRLSPETGKVDCLVLDLAGNLDEHLPLDGMPQFEEKGKAEPVERVVATSPWDVGARVLRHGTTASDLDPLAEYESKDGQRIRLRVIEMSYKLKPANKYPGRENLMAIYKCKTEQGVSKNVVKFVLFQYPGRPGLDAQDWLKRRGMALGQDIHPPYLLRAAYRASAPKYITVQKKGQWDELVEEIF